MTQGPAYPPEGFHKLGLHRVAILDFADATHQSVGGRIAGIFRTELAKQVGKEWLRTEALNAPDASTPLYGLIGINQAERIGRANGVDGLLEGQVLAYQWQRKPARVWVSVSLRLLETAQGTIIWSRNATGTAPVRRADDLNPGFDAAIKLAAKEFIHDLLGTPS